jgi:hypothetical protein
LLRTHPLLGGSFFFALAIASPLRHHNLHWFSH